ncbi:aminoacyl-tRNA hydrolase [Lipingzhangella sp. LS1_29]|uniref:Peptidyl-tRNA hydrolase n=1 Tax=Lipingzhangella rawalii TaxID=2055835 RepID=A0ABU2H9V9_9ACTN|nr:aminoacyl-tRNA hydrolase [Lipingzhangella rawalii]MDS1272110.1 aminoacyl-tRNA hydrolase [Lipingzhangella rawalii]
MGAAAERWLVVGLGNPGPRYARNRHNVGFMVVDLLAQRLGERWKPSRSRAELVTSRLAGTPVVLVKPRTYMNRSGAAVGPLCSYYGIPAQRVLVVHDELDLDFGVLKLKQGGGNNGHNGLRSVSEAVGGPEFLRVRFGVGRPPGRTDAATYVLQDFDRSERTDLGVHVERAADAVESVLADGLAKAQNTFH